LLYSVKIELLINLKKLFYLLENLERVKKIKWKNKRSILHISKLTPKYNMPDNLENLVKKAEIETIDFKNESFY
jgi:hypothetical protein